MESPNFRPDHVAGLFDRMASTYGAVNLASSLGFSYFWRKACCDELAPQTGERCADLMCGMGEMTALLKRTKGVSVEAIDFSACMCAKARATVDRHGWTAVAVRQADVLALVTEPSYERIAVTFGLKTLDDLRLKALAKVLSGLLCDGGRAALVEIHVPSAWILRWPYLIYLRWGIPVIGWLFQGDADCYRSLATYTEDFARRDRFACNLREVGLVVKTRSLFFGCARLYVADKFPQCVENQILIK